MEDVAGGGKWSPPFRRIRSLPVMVVVVVVAVVVMVVLVVVAVMVVTAAMSAFVVECSPLVVDFGGL